MRSIFLPHETIDPKNTLFIFFDIDETLLYGRASLIASECWVTCPRTLTTALETITQLCLDAGMNAQFGILTSKPHVDDLVEEAIGVLQNYIYCTNLDTKEQVQALSSRDPETPFIYMHSGYPCEQCYNAEKIPAVRHENPNIYSPIMLAENCLIDRRRFGPFLAHMAAYINRGSLMDFLQTIKEELKGFNRCYYNTDRRPEEKIAQLTRHFDRLREHMYNSHQPDNRPETAQKLLSRLSLEINCFLTNRKKIETHEKNDTQIRLSDLEWVDYRLSSDITNYEKLEKVLDFTSPTLLQTFTDAFHALARALREKDTLEQTMPEEQVQSLEELLNDARANCEKAKNDFGQAKASLQTAFNAGHKLQLLQHFQAKFNAPASNIFLIDDCLENTTAAEEAGFSAVSAAATADKLDLLESDSDLVQQPAWQEVLSASEAVLNTLREKVQAIIQHKECSSLGSTQPSL